MDKMSYEQNRTSALPRRKHSFVVKEQRSRALGFIPSLATNFSYNLGHITKSCASSVPPRDNCFSKHRKQLLQGTGDSYWSMENRISRTMDMCVVFLSRGPEQCCLQASGDRICRYNSSCDIAQCWEELTGAFTLFKIQFEKEIQFPLVLLRS